MVNNKQTCTVCGKLKAAGEFYASSSPFHSYMGRLHICKNCLWKYVDADNNENIDLNIVLDALRRIDRPFISELWQSSVTEAERDEKSIFKIYMKNLGMHQYRNLTWKDSKFEGFQNTSKLPNSTEKEIMVIDDEVRTYWGRNYNDWEYEYLENEKVKLISSFECPDYGMEMIMRDICFINLDIEKLRQEDSNKNQKAITQLIETRSKLMTDANMKPIQSTGSEANEQVTFGTLIKKWENERPIPPPLNDELKEYIDTFMVGHLAKMEGLNNELTEKYEKAIAPYTINVQEMNANKDDEEVD